MTRLRDGTRLHYKTCINCGKPFYTKAKRTRDPLCYECKAKLNEVRKRGRPSFSIPELDIEELKEELRR